ALQRVEPAGPAVEQTALDEQGIEEHRERGGPAGAEEAIGSAQRLLTQQVLCLVARVALLRCEPARQRLAVVVVDDALQRKHRAIDDDAMAVAFLPIAGLLASVENRAGGIQRSAQ